MKTNRMFLLSLPILLFVLVSGAQGQNPAGDEFQINTDTKQNQVQPSVSSDAEGNFVVVWTDNQGAGKITIEGQRYDKNGNPLGLESRVNTMTEDSYDPDVARHDAGGFVVVWTSDYGATYHSDIRGRRFAADGTPLDLADQIIASNTNYQLEPAVDSDAAGNFVVVWTETPDWIEYGTIHGELFDSNWGSQATFSPTVGLDVPYGWSPDVAMDGDGDFVVIWTAYYYSEGPIYGPYIYGQRYDNLGEKAGGLVDLGTGDNPPFGDQPAVDMDDQGNFVVVWTDYYSTNGDILGQRFNSAGVPLDDPPIVINTTTAYSQTNPNVSMDPNGNFVVSWTTPQGYDYGIAARRFAPDGTPIDAVQFQVNTTTSTEAYDPNYSLQTESAASMTTAENFVVTWASYGPDSDEFGVFGQRYRAPIVRELVADFGAEGLWHNANPWDKMSNWNPENIEAELLGMAVDFGGNGLWRHEGTWSKLSRWNADVLVSWGDKLIASFQEDTGLWLNDGTWSKKSGWDPENVVAWGDKFAADFGTNGLWFYDGAWSKLSRWDADVLAAWGDKLVASFQEDSGIWVNDGTWSKLSAWEPDQVEPWVDELAVDFGTNGLWKYNGVFTKLSNYNADDLVLWGTNLVVLFQEDTGIWMNDGTWNKISNWDPLVGQTEPLDGNLATCFGLGRGVWFFDGVVWSKQSGWDSEALRVVNFN
jgi:hypothetical protein